MVTHGPFELEFELPFHVSVVELRVEEDGHHCGGKEDSIVAYSIDRHCRSKFVVAGFIGSEVATIHWEARGD